jgi:hypothetical protein
VTRNEVAKSFNVPDQWFLAIVEVRSDDTGDLTYLRRPFTKTLEDAAASANYPIRELLEQGELVEVSA